MPFPADSSHDVLVTTQPIRVLVVEDCESQSNLLSVLFSHPYFASYRVDWELTYAAGFEAALRGEHDVAIFDHRLGPHTGLELLQAVGGDGCEMPIILLGGHDDVEIEQAAFDAGAADFLVRKKLRAPELARTIRHALWQARLIEALHESQSRLEHFMQNTPCATAIEDEAGGMLYQNDLFRRHFSSWPFGHFHPGEALGGPWSWAGGDRHWLIHAFPLPDVGLGGERCIAAFDVTAQIAAEDKLRRTTRTLDTLLANLPVIVGRIDDEGCVTEAQGSNLKQRGLSSTALVGRILWDVYPASRDEIMRALRGGSGRFVVSGLEDGENYRAEFLVTHDKESGAGAVFFGRDATEPRSLDRAPVALADGRPRAVGAEFSNRSAQPG